MDQSQSENIKKLYSNAMRFVNMQLDYARLTAAEKLSVLLSTIACFALVIVIGMITLVFISIGIGQLLASTIAPYTAYLIVSGFYLLLLIALVVFRRQIIFNPAARFLSRLLLKAPDSHHE